MTGFLRPGDQVKIVTTSHPWFGAIGRIIEPFGATGEHWTVELDTILPGQRAMAHKSELMHLA